MKLCGTSVSLSQCSLRAERIKMKKVLYEGPDISRHNGNVDIKSVRDAGYKRIGIRAGYGKNNVDQKYISNALACHNLGVNVLLYWFSYAYNVPMAAAEAEFAVSQAAKYWKKCPIAFDFEYDSVNYARNNGVRITEKLATDMAIAFLKGGEGSRIYPCAVYQQGLPAKLFRSEQNYGGNRQGICLVCQIHSGSEGRRG